MKSARESKGRFRLSIVLALLGNRLCYECGRLLSRGRAHADLTLPLDGRIPVLPWTVAVYFGCFAFWFLIARVVARQPKRAADRFFCAFLLGHAVCFLFFVLFPTTNVRPALSGAGVWDDLLRFLYRIDEADNLFPSIHCFISWLCWVGVRGNRSIGFPWHASALVMAIAVCFSTLTTRQHVLADVVGGILLGECCYGIAGAKRLLSRYSALVDAVLQRLGEIKHGS